MEKKLEVNNLQISFRTQGGILKAVRNISFDLYKGETLAIVGESGSGKSVTSKAIMGILAGNAIVEGGEILYSGQDLLKIDEEDFHKIRGDKIAMIFQDPMSSLNPIMRVGKQLTEAMLLKAKRSKKSSRLEFNNLLRILIHNVYKACGDNPSFNKSQVLQMFKTFDDFCLSNIKIEGIYNEAYSHILNLEIELENIILHLNKKTKIDYHKELKKIYSLYLKSLHPYLIKEKEDVNYQNQLIAFIKQKEINKKELLVLALDLKKYVNTLINLEQPNFFTLGFYTLKNPNHDLSGLSISELNKMTRDFIDENFMLEFIDIIASGVSYSHATSINEKIKTKSHLMELFNYFKNETITKNLAISKVKETAKKVKASIDVLQLKKNSIEYIFENALLSNIKTYFEGIKANPKEEKIYLKNKARYDRLINRNKVPSWLLKPQVIVDLDLIKDNICKIIDNLIKCYDKEIQSSDSFDPQAEAVGIIDYLKELASKVVVKMNKRIAKAKAIRLLEEVGIPEATIRYRQYPFEFSGGMRQRIVIAIALSANPDILICDEPTTALDVTIQAQILELINKIKEERHLSVIFITHNLGVVANMADRIAVMYAGKIVEYGMAEEIFYTPKHPYTWALLSSMPDLHTTEKLDSIPGTPPNMIYPPIGDAFAERNKYALAIDYEIEPPLFEVTKTHFAATWLLHPNAPKVKMPKIIQDRVKRINEEKKKDGKRTR